MITVYKVARLNHLEKDPNSYISFFYHSLPAHLILKYEIDKWTESKYPLFVCSNLNFAYSFVMTFGSKHDSVILMCETPEVFLTPRKVPDLDIIRNYPETVDEFWAAFKDFVKPEIYHPTSERVPLALITYKVKPIRRVIYDV